MPLPHPPPTTRGSRKRLEIRGPIWAPPQPPSQSAIDSPERPGSGRAIAAGAQPSSELLWDCGLYAALAARSDSGAGSAELALMGDAAWKAGEAGIAKTRWARSIAFEPRRSWKAYANLALSSEPEVAESYWARMKSAFLSAPASELRDGALAVYVARLGRENRDKEALALLAGGSIDRSREGRLSVLDLSLRGRVMPEGRLAVEFERLVARRPEDPLVVGIAAMRSLLQRGLFGEVALLEAGAEKSGLALERRLVLRGRSPRGEGRFRGPRLQGAIEESPAALASYEGLFALGRLCEARAKACGCGPTPTLRRSERRASPGTSAAALKALGRELGSRPETGREQLRLTPLPLVADPRDRRGGLCSPGSRIFATSN